MERVLEGGIRAFFAKRRRHTSKYLSDVDLKGPVVPLERTKRTSVRFWGGRRRSRSWRRRVASFAWTRWATRSRGVFFQGNVFFGC